MNTLVINHLGREKRYALLKNNKLEKIVIHQPKMQSSVGAIYLGIVSKVLPGMNAAFIDIGQSKNGFLHRDKLPAYLQSKNENKSISSYLHQGEKLLVQVEKDPTGTKGPRLTGILEFNGSSTVYMPNGHYVAVSKKIPNEEKRDKWRQFGFQIKREEEGILFRTSCQDFSEDEISNEIEQLRKKYEEVQRESQNMKKPGLILENNTFLDEIVEELSKDETVEIVVDDQELKKTLTSLTENKNIDVSHYHQTENIFAHFGIQHEIEKSLKKVVWLKNGAYLIFDETEALTIIDVNTGKFSGKHDLEETVVKTNEWAAVEIARQIRLRDIAGMILVDFIDMKSDDDRQKIMKAMKDSLLKDEKRTRVIGFTPLGILQMTRKKTRVSISEALTTRCEVCEGTGKVLSPETVAFQLERDLWELKGSDHEAVLIEASHDVREVFSGADRLHQQRLEKTLGLQFYFSIKEDKRPFYTIRQLGSPAEIQQKAND